MKGELKSKCVFCKEKKMLRDTLNLTLKNHHFKYLFLSRSNAALDLFIFSLHYSNVDRLC